MVVLNKKLKFTAIEEKEMSPEAFSSITQIIAKWIVREMRHPSDKTASNTLTVKHPVYTINSKKDW